MNPRITTTNQPSADNAYNIFESKNNMAMFQTKFEDIPKVSKIKQQIIGLNNSYNNYKNNQSTTTLVTGFQEFLPQSLSTYDDETDDYFNDEEDINYVNDDDDGDDEGDESEEESRCVDEEKTTCLIDTKSLLPSPIYSVVNHQQQLLKDYQSQQDQIDLFSKLTMSNYGTENFASSPLGLTNSLFSSFVPFNNNQRAVNFFDWSGFMANPANMFNYNNYSSYNNCNVSNNIISTLTGAALNSDLGRGLQLR